MYIYMCVCIHGPEVLRPLSLVLEVQEQDLVPIITKTRVLPIRNWVSSELSCK